MQRCHPLLKLAPRGGRIVVIGSKNVPAPGPGAAAYSASKAALNQLARVAALEWAKDGIRINSLHPERGLRHRRSGPTKCSPSRAKAYNLTVEQYKKQQPPQDRGGLAATWPSSPPRCAAPLFAKTTAAQVPVDGGNERVV